MMPAYQPGNLGAISLVERYSCRRGKFTQILWHWQGLQHVCQKQPDSRLGAKSSLARIKLNVQVLISRGASGAGGASGASGGFAGENGRGRTAREYVYRWQDKEAATSYPSMFFVIPSRLQTVSAASYICSYLGLG
jgi:hypothetical protein